MSSLTYRPKDIRASQRASRRDRTNGQRADDQREAGETNDDEPSEEADDTAENDDDDEQPPDNETSTSDDVATADAAPPAPQPPAPGQEILINPGQPIKIVFNSTPEPTREPQPDPKKDHPQARMLKFWHNFEPEYEGGVTQILPEGLAPATTKTRKDSTLHADHSYQKAREQCVKQVNRIVRECKALNQRYTDVHFDIERDLKITEERDCLYGLIPDPDNELNPMDVQRVTEIFDKPQFYKDGAGFDDIIQGFNGDCWLLSALSAIAVNQDWVYKVCVKQDQEIGVYGFVFYRDGEWQPCIIDDKLYLKAPSFIESAEVLIGRYGVQHRDQEKRYRNLFQKGSKALYFAACRDQNETWVPLLEKALAKAHGDYSALHGGWTGEAIEDLTGGVTTEIYTNTILSKDTFWQDLQRIGKDFAFSAAMACYQDWRDTGNESDNEARGKRSKGIVSRHAYAVLATYEGHGQRLIKMRNPWGRAEWTGPWSDGSKEWSADWFVRLNHKFGDDGVFWMNYDDMLEKYRYVDRTRLFGAEWQVAQQWVGVQVPWNSRDYQQTKFTIKVPTDTEAVIVLSQLDERYFLGLQGKYVFSLSFRIQRDGDDEDDYIARSKVNYEMTRSTNVEVQLEKGTYTVLFKVEAQTTSRMDVEEVVRQKYKMSKEKLIQMATLYDLALAKGKPAKKEKVKEPPKAQESVVKLDQSSKPPQREEENNDQFEDAASMMQGSANRAGKQSGGRRAMWSRTIGGTRGDDENDDDQPKDKKDEEADEKEEAKGEDTKPKPDDKDPDRTPWNAFCVVGLRVYSKLSDLELNVVQPNPERPVALDRDDIAKSAVDEANTASAPPWKANNGREDDNDSSDDNSDDD